MWRLRYAPDFGAERSAAAGESTLRLRSCRTRSSRQEHQIVQRGGQGVVARCRAPRTGADESTWTTRRVGRRGAAGRRRTGPAEIKTSQDGRGALTHRMMTDLKSSFDGRRALTHRMTVYLQRRANVPLEAMDRDLCMQLLNLLIWSN